MGQVELRKRRTWRRRTYIWVLSSLTAVSALIYWEQTALLFVLSTVAMSVLLTMVAFSDLEGRDRELHNQFESEATSRIQKTTTSPTSVPVGSSARKREKGAA